MSAGRSRGHMNVMGRRIIIWLLPSMVAALWGAVIVGLIDGWLGARGTLQGLGAAGFSSFVLVPLGLVAALLGRALWHAWKPRELLAGVVTDTGGAPRLAAWTVYVLTAAWGVAVATFNIVRLLQKATSAKGVIALSAALLVTSVALLLVIGSRPSVRLLSFVLGRLDRMVHARLGKSVITPTAIALTSGVLLGALLVGGWLVSIRPRIGHLDITLGWYAALFVAVLAVLHGLWPRISSRRAVQGAVTGTGLFLGALVISSAMYLRHERPYSMITVWAHTEMAGTTIDFLYDIESLRHEMRIMEFRPAERPDTAHPDVVLITVDTMRADRIAAYGGKVMPTLTALAREGSLFEWAFSPSNVTRRSLPAMITGLHATRVNGRVAGWALRLDPRHVVLAERFLAAGYDTAGFFCCASHFAPEGRLGMVRGLEHVYIEKDGKVLADMARRWIDQRDATRPAKPLFVWMHFIEPHLWESDYPPKRHGKEMGPRYDRSLTEIDGFLKTLLSVLWTQERKQRTILVVTADHSESLGDHGLTTHATSLYNSETRVPWIIAGPGVRAQRIAQPVSGVQIPATLLDLAGFLPPGPPELDGASLAPLVRGELADDPSAGEAFLAMIQDRSIRQTMHALVLGRHKYIERHGQRRSELYDIIADPNEQNNLANDADQAALVARMRERLAEILGASRAASF